MVKQICNIAGDAAVQRLQVSKGTNMSINKSEVSYELARHFMAGLHLTIRHLIMTAQKTTGSKQAKAAQIPGI